MATVSESQQTQAYEKIRQDIIFARLKPGEKIVPKDLCDRFDVGRTPVREALVRLQQEGLVRTVPQSGTYVSKIDLHSAECARFVREHLERQVAIECCARYNPTDLHYLTHIIQLQEAAAREGNREDFFVSDNMLHRALFQIADRAEIWEWLESMSTNLQRYRWLRIRSEDLQWNELMDQHYRLCDAIVNHLPDEAGYLVSLHLHMMFDEQAQVVSEYPGYFETAASPTEIPIS